MKKPYESLDALVEDLLLKYEEAEEARIWEYSTSIREDEDILTEELAFYRSEYKRLKKEVRA